MNSIDLRMANKIFSCLHVHYHHNSHDCIARKLIRLIRWEGWMSGLKYCMIELVMSSGNLLHRHRFGLKYYNIYTGTRMLIFFAGMCTVGCTAESDVYSIAGFISSVCCLYDCSLSFH